MGTRKIDFSGLFLIVFYELHIISWQVLSLNDSERRVAELVGATESLLSRKATGQRSKMVIVLFSSIIFVSEGLDASLTLLRLSLGSSRNSVISHNFS